MLPLSPKIQLSEIGAHAVLWVRRAFVRGRAADTLFTIEVVTQSFPATIVHVVTARVPDHEAAKTLVRYIWKCRADPQVAVRAVDARGKERYRFDAAGAWTLHPEQTMIRLLPVGLRRSIHRVPNLWA